MSSKADSARRCAYCRQQPVLPAFRPFCSAGCRARDLNAWLSDSYAIPASTEDDELLPSSPLDNGNEAG
jgi:endogenous inhibitor of DNA gyrase (YacG/DUF329 family)